MAQVKPQNSLAKIKSEPGITKSQKAAIILASLSAETATAIVDEINDAQLRAFAKAFSELKSVPPQLLHAIAAEFVSEVQGSSTELAGGIDEARRVLGELAEEERVNRVLSELAGGGSESVWVRIGEMDDKTIAEYVQAERMPVAATILAKLSIEKTAAILDHAEADFAKDILLEMARKSPPSEAVIQEIAYAVEEDLLKPMANKPSGGNAGAVVGEIINFLPAAKRDAFLEYLQETDKEIGAEARKSVITFEELHQRVPAAAAPALLREIEHDVLLAAIRYGEANAQETVNFLLGNISKRMAEQYREELAEMDEIKQKQGEDAQRNFISTLRQMTRDGDLELIPLPSTEEGEEEE